MILWFSDIAVKEHFDSCVQNNLVALEYMLMKHDIQRKNSHWHMLEDEIPILDFSLM